MGPQNSPAVTTLQLAEPRKPPVDVHIMDEEIDQAVQADTDGHPQQPSPTGKTGKDKPHHAWNSKYQEKQVVLLEEMPLLQFWIVMVPVPSPQPSVHDILVG